MRGMVSWLRAGMMRNLGGSGDSRCVCVCVYIYLAVYHEIYIWLHLYN